MMLAFGRGIGDAAAVLFTAGYTDRMPTSLMRPVASLPLAVFFQLGTPYPEVQQRAYASALDPDRDRAGRQPGIALAGRAAVAQRGQ